MMKTDNKQTITSESGFTLVELAVVMIIIGLLIGGVLKGQELIANAQVTSTVSQVQGYDAATTTFRDMYDVMPGDMVNAAARLPNCAGDCALAPTTAGNRRVDGAFGAAPSNDMIAYWANLNAADLIGGLDAQGLDAWGSRWPEAEVGGGFYMAYAPDAAGLTAVLGAPTARAGHYLVLHADPTAAIAAGTSEFLPPQQAFRIDNKLDDGVPNSGNVLAMGDATCIAGTIYDESLPAPVCGLYIRFQN